MQPGASAEPRYLEEIRWQIQTAKEFAAPRGRSKRVFI
jgi:hypothetical protein